MTPTRKRMPSERVSITRKFVINATIKEEVVPINGYLTVGFFDDGTPGEIFIKMDRQGSEVSGFIDAWAISVSMLLQLGMPLQSIIDKFRGSRFEPSGLTGDPEHPFAASPLDLISRLLARYVDGPPDAQKK